MDSMLTKNTRDERRFSPDKMQKVNMFETERMFADIYCLEPGQQQRIHAHAGADKIYFVVEGVAHFHIGGEERDLGPDNIVLAPSDIEHGVINNTNEQVVLLVFLAPNPNVKR